MPCFSLRSLLTTLANITTMAIVKSATAAMA
jgi:hypothetical protein